MISHNDIYIKFMIEYDKAGAQTSYPSLTEYEVATFLDKAYNALIAQKVTGNNYRRAGFEADLKSIADISPLLISTELWNSSTDTVIEDAPQIAQNCRSVDLSGLDPEMLYFIQAAITVSPPLAKQENVEASEPFTSYEYNHGGERLMEWGSGSGNHYRQTAAFTQPLKLVDHNTASKFFASLGNIPWVKQPVCYLENKMLYVVYDALNTPSTYGITDTTDSRGVSHQTVTQTKFNDVKLTYIKKPHTFVKDLEKYTGLEGISYFSDVDNDDFKFECNSTVAEELVSLAVSFALENVESQRLNSKLNMRGLEA